MFTPFEMRPCCTRCENVSDEMRSRGDMLLCPACFEGFTVTCDDCGCEFPEHSLIDADDGTGEMRCKECHEQNLENQAERAWEASCEDYYGGGCSAEVYERASQREFNRSMKK